MLYLSKSIKQTSIYGKRFEVVYKEKFQYLKIITDNAFVKNMTQLYLIPSILKHLVTMDLTSLKLNVVQIRMDNGTYSPPFITSVEKIDGFDEDFIDNTIYRNNT